MALTASSSPSGTDSTCARSRPVCAPMRVPGSALGALRVYSPALLPSVLPVHRSSQEPPLHTDGLPLNVPDKPSLHTSRRRFLPTRIPCPALPRRLARLGSPSNTTTRASSFKQIIALPRFRAVVPPCLLACLAARDCRRPYSGPDTCHRHHPAIDSPSVPVPVTIAPSSPAEISALDPYRHRTSPHIPVLRLRRRKVPVSRLNVRVSK
ncbi:hypothetical protein C8R45DRAFT_1026425 [Mycena sanguinolenta]|nr:hypothetical protein C8R45DRAFT_1026425 [Mycena sanguinolenta]